MTGMPAALIQIQTDPMTTPRYITAADDGTLARKIDLAHDRLSRCCLCPRQCGINRNQNEKGRCRTGKNALIASFSPHFGEEPCISGTRGSGTIFFAGCSLLCCFCQNFDISHPAGGQNGIREATPGQTASVMLHLQDAGCHNINLVTPTHVVPQILDAVLIAKKNGLTIPLVYNSSGYEAVATLELLDGIIDIYMPDFKFWDPAVAAETCQADDYPDQAKKAVREMQRQVGDLKTDRCGIAESGLLVRHLVMPENYSGTRDILEFLKTEVSSAVHVNIMSQYRPMGTASQIPAIDRPVSVREFRHAVETAESLGINRIS